jgi:hypothetical protein
MRKTTEAHHPWHTYLFVVASILQSLTFLTLLFFSNTTLLLIAGLDMI